MHPELGPLRAVVQALEQAGAQAALGGSGLLYSLGLTDRVRDWDLTTDAPPEVVLQALRPFSVTYPDHGDGRYRTGYRLSIREGNVEIDLIGHFAIETATGVCRLPALVGGRWQGVPVGSPEVWAVAYRLMERHPKADLLDGYLHAHGARGAVVTRLLSQPLPSEVAAAVAAWPVTPPDDGSQGGRGAQP